MLILSVNFDSARFALSVFRSEIHSSTIFCAIYLTLISGLFNHIFTTFLEPQGRTSGSLGREYRLAAGCTKYYYCRKGL